MLRVRIMPRYQEPITLTISIVRLMNYVVLENIRGDFSDNTAFPACKLRIIFKNIGRSVRTVPCRAPYPFPPPPPPKIRLSQQNSKPCSNFLETQTNIEISRQSCIVSWFVSSEQLFFQMNLFPCLRRKWGHRLNCKTLYLSWSVSLFMR